MSEDGGGGGTRRLGVALSAIGALACVSAGVAGGSDGRAAATAGSLGREVSVAAPPEPDRFDVVVIDAGHGGSDRGARGQGGLLEKDLVLDVSRRVARRLHEQKLRVVLTRTDDRFVGLEERTGIANDARADLFLSIHANAASSRGARGIETFFAALDASDESARELARRENQAFGDSQRRSPRGADPLVAIFGDMIATEHLRESQEFASLAQGRLKAVDLARSRGVKQAPFVVLMGVQMPAALVEVGFISNPEDERLLRRSVQRERIAEALADAVHEFGKRYDARRGVPKESPASRGAG